MGLDAVSDDIVRDEYTNIISVSTEYPKTCRGLGYEFFNSMQQHKDKVAQYIADTGEIDTYESFLKRAVRTALHLRNRNLTKDDVVCLCSYNHLNNYIPFVACLFLGIPVASLDPTFTVSDATHLIKLIKPKVFFIVSDIIDVITQSIENAGLESAEVIVYDGDDVDTDNFIPFTTFLAEHEEEDSFKPAIIKDVSQTAVIFFSSGTTGLPKGICSSHKAIYHQGFLVNQLGLLGPDAVTLLYSTLYWVSAVLNFSGCVLSGSARLVCKKYDPENTWYLIDKYKVTYAFFAPIQAYNMITKRRPEGIDTSSLYIVVTGGAHFSIEKLYELRDLLPGTFVFQGFGCTEVSGLATVFNLRKTNDRLLLNYRPAACGRPVAGFEYKVVDIETENNCGPNERGELRIRSEFNLNGYYQQDSSSAYDSEGWLCTGDIVYYDEDFCFYIVDRIKEMLKFRSWHVPPALLEGVLQTHPSVKQCVVIGIPHEEDGDLPMAVIVLHDSYIGNVTGTEIEKFVADRVNDTHKLRGGVKFMSDIPVTPSGKVKKKQIKEMVLNGLI